VIISLLKVSDIQAKLVSAIFPSTSTTHPLPVADNLPDTQPASLKMTPMLRQDMKIREEQPSALP